MHVPSHKYNFVEQISNLSEGMVKVVSMWCHYTNRQKRIKRRPMLQQMRSQQNTKDSVFRLAQMTMCIMMLHPFCLLTDQTSFQLVRQTGCQYVNSYLATCVNSWSIRGTSSRLDKAGHTPSFDWLSDFPGSRSCIRRHLKALPRKIRKV